MALSLPHIQHRTTVVRPNVMADMVGEREVVCIRLHRNVVLFVASSFLVCGEVVVLCEGGG